MIVREEKVAMSSCTGRRRADRSRCRIESLSCEKNVGRVEEGPKSVVVVRLDFLSWSSHRQAVGARSEMLQKSYSNVLYDW